MCSRWSVFFFSQWPGSLNNSLNARASRCCKEYIQPIWGICIYTNKVIAPLLTSAYLFCNLTHLLEARSLLEFGVVLVESLIYICLYFILCETLDSVVATCFTSVHQSRQRGPPVCSSKFLRDCTRPSPKTPCNTYVCGCTQWCCIILNDKLFAVIVMILNAHSLVW